MSWDSTNRINLKKPLSQQKHSVQITNNRTLFVLISELFKSQKMLNIYKFNFFSVAVFIYQFRNKTGSLTFSRNFEKIWHEYPTIVSQFKYKICKTAFSKSKFRISFRGSSIWNNLLQNYEKEIESLPLFRSKLKLKLLSFSDEFIHFWNISVGSQHSVDEKRLDDKPQRILAIPSSF